MQSEPTGVYVVQPDPATGEENPCIFTLAGPETEEYRDKRFTKAEAQLLANILEVKRRQAAPRVAE